MGLKPLAFVVLLRLREICGLAQGVVIQGCLEWGTRGFGEDALFLQGGQDAHEQEGKGHKSV